MSWRDKFANFMYGRYGVDELSKFMLLVTFILCIVSMFVNSDLSSFTTPRLVAIFVRLLSDICPVDSNLFIEP